MKTQNNKSKNVKMSRVEYNKYSSRHSCMYGNYNQSKDTLVEGECNNNYLFACHKLTAVTLEKFLAHEFCKGIIVRNLLSEFAITDPLMLPNSKFKHALYIIICRMKSTLYLKCSFVYASIIYNLQRANNSHIICTLNVWFLGKRAHFVHDHFAIMETLPRPILQHSFTKHLQRWRYTVEQPLVTSWLVARCRHFRYLQLSG